MTIKFNWIQTSNNVVDLSSQARKRLNENNVLDRLIWQKCVMWFELWVNKIWEKSDMPITTSPLRVIAVALERKGHCKGRINRAPQLIK